jgi:cysteinyl-tRNA synthetase
MSKSIGNIVTPRELLDAGWPGEVLRLALLSAHYRQPLQWTDALLEQSRRVFQKLCSSFHHLGWNEQASEHTDHASDAVIDPLLDDLSIKRAVDGIHALSEAAKDAGSVVTQVESRLGGADSIPERQSAAAKELVLRHSLMLLGIDARLENEDTFRATMNAVYASELEAELTRYRDARAAKDWAAADAIRDALKAEGIEISVAKDGSTSWRKA